jgi:hypothetical protein
MANIEEMDRFVLEQAFLGRPWSMGAGPFVDDEGFYFQPQPHQPQPEALLTYNTTIHSNALSFSDVSQGGHRSGLGFAIERQSSTSGSEDLATYDTVQYGEALVSSSMIAVLPVNNNRPSVDKPQVSARRSSINNKRKFEDHVGRFSIRGGAEEYKRKRQAYDQETREEVALMRIVGPCSRCQAKKVKVRCFPNLGFRVHLTFAVPISRPLPGMCEGGRREHQSRRAHLHQTDVYKSPVWPDELW